MPHSKKKYYNKECSPGPNASHERQLNNDPKKCSSTLGWSHFINALTLLFFLKIANKLLKGKEVED